MIGVAFDGTGYGTDGTIWGGEFLIAGLADFERAGHLALVPMPGGAAAIRQPWRMAAVYLEAGADEPRQGGAVRRDVPEPAAAQHPDGLLEARGFGPPLLIVWAWRGPPPPWIASRTRRACLRR